MGYLSKHEESSCMKSDRERSNSLSKKTPKEPTEGATPLPVHSSASSQLSLTRLLTSPSLLPHSQISQATLQALKMAGFANSNKTTQCKINQNQLNFCKISYSLLLNCSII